MDAGNPYAAPQAAAGIEPTHRLAIHHAGRWRRLFNWLIDKFAIMGVSLAAGVVIALAGGDEAIAWLEGMSRWEEYLLGLPIYVAYYTVMEGLFGLTVGKLLTGTRVVDDKGQPITFRHAVLRSLCRLIPFEAFSVLMADDAALRGWHDSIPGTHVVLHRAPAAQALPVVAGAATGPA